MNRRAFLKGMGLSVAAATAGVSALVAGERRARAFGEVPRDAIDASIPPTHRVDSILEVFLYGGLSQYESFYCVPEHGAEDGSGWSLFLNSGDVQAALDACNVQGPLTQPFARDSEGQMVNMGPFAMPLRLRPDVLARTRVAITAHDLEPHEGAIPLMLAGRRLGDPSLAGLGAHVQRYFQDQAPNAGRAPFSYVLRPQTPGFPPDNVNCATAIGFHPGATRPLSVTVDAAGNLDALLARPALGPQAAAYDSAMSHYLDRQRGRLRWNGTPTRAPRLEELAAGARSMAHADAIRGVIDQRLLAPTLASACGDTSIDTTSMSLRLAAHLLTHPTAPARYACVIDGGLVMADGGGGYDSHAENSHTQARNLGQTLRSLMSIINAPGEHDPAKLDLDRTMIVLTTEFGRSPTAQDGGKGRNHWPHGFPTTFIGGPIRAPGVFGACGSDGRAVLASTPQENRIAALLALGIWPFAPESYSISDVPDATSATEAAVRVKQRQLGLA